MNTLLTNFSPSELAFLIQLVETRWNEETASIVSLEVRYIDHELLHANETYLAHCKEQALASLWLTQLQTALEIVKHREAINAN